MDSTNLKTKIRAHLATANEATAGQISKALGLTSTPSLVISALGEMRTDAEVECEKKKGKGNEYWYWLTKASVATAKDPVVRKPVITPVPVPVAKTPESSPVEQQVSHGLEMYNLRKQLKLAEEMRDSHFARAEAATGRAADLLNQLRAVENNRESIESKLGDLSLQLNKAQETIHSMELEALQAKSVTEAAVGYIVRVVGRKPRICIKPENARNAALSSARAHGRADVLALVPVGKAVRGAEWKEAS